MTETIYDFSVKNIAGEEISLSEFKGKVLLIVNVASKCGFTSQYQGLQELHEALKDKGFAVLGFPCNQFGAQEPGTETEIKNFCETNYNVTFPLFSKIEVNGDNTHPLYKYLKSSIPGILGTEAIKWNFTKFLIDKQGKVIDRFGSATKPSSILSEIEACIAK